MVGGGEIYRFAGLAHEVANTYLQSGAGNDRGGDAGDQQVWDDAREKGSRAEGDQVGFGHSGERFGQGLRAAGQDSEIANGGARFRDLAFAGDECSVLELGRDDDVFRRGRNDFAGRSEDAAGKADGAGEIAGEMGERGEKKIAEAMALKTASGGKTVLKKLAKKCFFLREGNHAIANIAGREDGEIFPQASGTSAVVGDRYDGGERGDGIGA